MTPNASAARSPSANNRRAAAPLAAKCLTIIGIPVVGLYLAGYLLLWSLSLPPWQATPLTLLRYAHYYGDRDEIRRRLVVCSLVAASAVAVACIAVLRPPARPLHGDPTVRKKSFDRVSARFVSLRKRPFSRQQEVGR